MNTVSLSQNGSDIVCWYCISFRIHPPNFLYNPLFLLSTLNIKSNSFSLSILGGSSTCVYTSFWVQGWGFDELDSFDLLKIKWSFSATRMIPCTGSDWFQWEDRATPIKGSYDATHGIIRAYSERFRNHFRRSCSIPKVGSFDTAHGITRSYFYQFWNRFRRRCLILKSWSLDATHDIIGSYSERNWNHFRRSRPILF